MQLARFLARRLALLVPLLLLVAALTFFLLRVGGQDPTAAMAGPLATARQLALLRAQYGLDRPLSVQFVIWLGHVLHGDFGSSWITGKPVIQELLRRVPASLELLVLGVAVGSLVGIPAGIFSAFHRGGWFDQLSRLVSLLGFSIPTYFLGLLMLLVFFADLNWAPPGMGRLSLMLTPPPHVTGSYLIDGLIAGQWDVVQSAAAQLVLPVLSIAIIFAAPIVKQVRAIALDLLGSDHVRYAGAQGLPRRLIRRMTLRGASAPVTIFISGEFTALIGSVSLIEYVFAWNGVGQYGLEAIVRGDFNVVQAYVLLLALFSIVVFLIADLIVLAIEPRSRRAA